MTRNRLKATAEKKIISYNLYCPKFCNNPFSGLPITIRNHVTIYMTQLSNNTNKITSRILLTKYERNYFIYVAWIIRHALLKHTPKHIAVKRNFSLSGFMDRESKILAINYFLCSQLPSFIFFVFQGTGCTVFHF
jgi:hypothetical protein